MLGVIMGILENIGTPEIIILAVVLLIIFGPKKLPEFAKGLADASKEIMKAFKSDDHSDSLANSQSDKHGSPKV